MSRFFTPAEAAAATGYSRRWILRQVELGRLIAVAFDTGGRRSLRIRDTDLARFRADYLRDARELPRRDEA
jgi:hypothetical protein